MKPLAKPEEMKSALIQAADGDLDWVKELLEDGADPNGMPFSEFPGYERGGRPTLVGTHARPYSVFMGQVVYRLRVCR